MDKWQKCIPIGQMSVSGMFLTFLLRLGLYNCIKKLSFKHNKYSVLALPITRELSRVALQNSIVVIFRVVCIIIVITTD